MKNQKIDFEQFCDVRDVLEEALNINIECFVGLYLNDRYPFTIENDGIHLKLDKRDAETFLEIMNHIKKQQRAIDVIDTIECERIGVK